MYAFGLQTFLFYKKCIVAMEIATTWGLGYHEEAGHFYKVSASVAFI